MSFRNLIENILSDKIEAAPQRVPIIKSEETLPVIEKPKIQKIQKIQKSKEIVANVGIIKTENK